MKICWRGFNHYLVPIMVLALLCGCQTPERKRKQAITSIRLHLEAHPDPTGRTEVVAVHQNPLVQMSVDKTPFLTDADLQSAKLIEVVGGYAVKLQFDKKGTWILEEYTSGNLGSHLVIFCQFPELPEYKLNHGRWLAAMKISARIGDGSLVFAPDATREETELIVLGLNHVAKELGNATPERSYSDQ